MRYLAVSLMCVSIAVGSFAAGHWMQAAQASPARTQTDAVVHASQEDAQCVGGLRVTKPTPRAINATAETTMTKFFCNAPVSAFKLAIDHCNKSACPRDGAGNFCVLSGCGGLPFYSFEISLNSGTHCIPHPSAWRHGILPKKNPQCATFVMRNVRPFLPTKRS